MGMPTEDSIKKYKEDVQDMVDELLVSLDEHTYENNYTLYGDHLIYPMIVTTLVDGDNYGDVYMGGTTSGDLWDTFIDNLSRDYDGDTDDYVGIRSDQYHQLTKLKKLMKIRKEYEGNLSESQNWFDKTDLANEFIKLIETKLKGKG